MGLRRVSMDIVDNIIKDLRKETDKTIVHALEVLTRMFSVRPIYYEDFNKIFAMDDKVQDFRALEDKFQEIGMAKACTPDEGFSIASFISTVSRLFLGFSLGFSMRAVRDKNEEEHLLITGVNIYEQNTPPSVSKIEEETLEKFKKEYGIVPITTEISHILNTIDVNRV
jgi:hypothetical protein